jgi:hypothetical protein
MGTIIKCNKTAISHCVDDVFSKHYPNTYPNKNRNKVALSALVPGGIDPVVHLIGLCNAGGCTTAVATDALHYKISTVGALKNFIWWWCSKPHGL